MRAHRYLIFLALNLCFAVCALSIAFDGIVGILPDSSSYVLSALSLPLGQGMVALSNSGELVPSSHFPPLFSIFLAWFLNSASTALADVEVPLAGLGLVSVLLVYLILSRILANDFTAFWCVLLFTLAPPVVFVFTHLLSEPLFIVLELVIFLILQLAQPRPSGTLHFCAGIFSGLAILCRYLGGGLAIGALLALAQTPAVSGRARIQAVGVYLVGVMLPLMGWIMMSTSDATFLGRTFEWHLPPADRLLNGLQEFGSWLVPTFARTVQIIVGGLLLTFFFAARTSETKPSTLGNSVSLARNLALGLLLYLLVSITLFDFAIPLNRRILAPLFPIFFIGFLAIAVPQIRTLSKSSRVLRASGIGMLGIVFCGYLLSFWNFRLQALQHGLGFNTPAWRNSGLIAAIRKVPAGSLVVTNGPDFVYLFADRFSGLLPARLAEGSQRLNEHVGEDLAQLALQSRSRETYLAYFHSIGWRRYLVTEPELQAGLPLRLIGTYGDGNLYRVGDEG